jgi:3-phenylpropionate/trans-cinnamate dioxygenase ferredoxin subunit
MTGPRVCALSDLDDRKPFAVEVGDTPVVLVRDGEVTTKGIECFLHGSCFDLRTGQPSSPPATEPVDVFAVSVVDGDVHVDTDRIVNR